MARTDPLATYNKKRDFAKTKEPKGARDESGGNSFIVQKHDATRLHWDFRLEADGVLKSWAVTRGPSLNPDDKRLAVRTEDHPLSYATFEGTIPKGEYGGGTVMLWDRGTWAPIEGKSAKDIDEGHLHFTLDGERMKGEWILVRMKRRPGEKNENWLLRKVEDAEAGGSDDLTGRCLTSVTTGRTMEEIATGAPAPAEVKPKQAKVPAKRTRAAAKKGGSKALPAFHEPQLATLVDNVPTGNGWLHEIKYDGYRCLLAVAPGKARIYTRSGLDWTDKFPNIARVAAEADFPSMLIDGEIVTFDKKGSPSFSALQESLKAGREDFTLFAFDLLEEEGEDLTRLPNSARKERLAALIGTDDKGPIRYADHIVGAGEKLFETMCEAGQEGIISKRADAPYRGKRTQNWLKVKCTHRQEFVIVGWSPSSAKARPFRSLLLAVNEGGTLRYAGKVGTGFGGDTLDMLASKLRPLEQKKATVEAPRSETRGVHWVEPKLVAEIAFAEFTHENILRHASFLGLREDKDAKSVTRETPAHVPAAAPTPAPVTNIKISSRDRVVFPDAGFTKGNLADYYAKIASIMLPWVGNRPISLVRCPQGRAKKCFFQKHDSGSFGDHVAHVPITEKDGHSEDYLYVADAEGILACVQMGTIELHGWGSRVDHLEQPDRMVFDLDPDEGLDFEDVKTAARDIRQHLADIGLVSFPMLSGGKGIHVIVPLRPEADWPTVKDFTHRFSEALAQAEPERFVATMSKAKRKGRIFIDWLRNQRGATAIMPYAVRAREGAPVAAPITWEELRDVSGAGIYSIADADKLLKRAAGKSLAGWGEADQSLPNL